MKCSVIDNKMDPIEEDGCTGQANAPSSHVSSASGQVSAAQTIFNSMFETSPNICKPGVCGMAGSTRSNYNETILENS